jgi:hypothetical protein
MDKWKKMKIKIFWRKGGYYIDDNNNGEMDGNGLDMMG